MNNHVPSIKVFPIPEPEFALLEKHCATMHEGLTCKPEVYFRPDMQIAFEDVKRILSDARWGGGPYLEVKTVPLTGDDA